MSQTELKWNDEEVFSFLREEFPQVFEGGKSFSILSLEPDRLELAFTAGPGQLRPGGTVSGPAQMELADLAVYFLLLAHHGKAARLCVTTSLNCSFLRKPEAGELVCEVQMIKHGRTLSIADVNIKALDGRILAHLELTYYTGNLVA